MRALFTFLFLLSGTIYGQYEFNQYPNGLIYSNAAIANLGKIIGEENERFRQCDLTKTFKAVAPTTAGVYYVEPSAARTARRDLRNGMKVREFESKYRLEAEEMVLAVKREGSNYEGKEFVYIDAYPGIEMQIPKGKWTGSHQGLWIFHEDYDENLVVLRLDRKFQTVSIPYKYARMIQYSECMVDTTQQLFTYKQDWKTQEDYPEDNAITDLFNYIDEELGEKAPEWTMEMKPEEYDTLDTAYQSKRQYFLDRTLSKKPQFKAQLEAAYEFALDNEASTYQLEDLVEAYLGRREALDLKRSRRVIGMCSMDSSPRYHAMNIAQLAAESFSWDLFLRAHLDILNDNFSRASDGSYAWAGRQTYVKEMEILDIEVGDLLLGITFRVQNPSPNHYYGSIRRLGRAISESKDRDAIVSTIKEGIADTYLDTYNRMLLFYLYANTTYQKNLAAGVEFDREQVEQVRTLLPAYLHDLDY